MTPLFSVIMPVYNAAPFLHRSIDSILGQSFRNFELILVDDGSTDSSASVCKEYLAKDSRVRFISQPNSGASVARNAGMEHASAPWITFCDADDFVYPDWLETFHSRIDAGFDLICQGIRTDKPTDYDNPSLERCFDFEGDNADFLDSLFMHSLMGYVVLKAFRAKLIREHNIRFIPSVRLQEDNLFVYQYLSFCNKAVSVSSIGYYYFVPDWTGKYTLTPHESISRYEMGINILSSPRFAHQPQVLKKEIALLARCCLVDFCSTGRRSSFHKLRSIHRQDFSATEMFFLSRLLLVLDFTEWFSSRFIKLVHGLRRHS